MTSLFIFSSAHAQGKTLEWCGQREPFLEFLGHQPVLMMMTIGRWSSFVVCADNKEARAAHAVGAQLDQRRRIRAATQGRPQGGQRAVEIGREPGVAGTPPHGQQFAHQRLALELVLVRAYVECVVECENVLNVGM
jgi:hypothetical protein